MTTDGIDFVRIPTGEVELHTATAGPADGPLVVLLHGFPEFWYGWRHQIPALAAAGYHVLAPDQRGYDLSDRPEGVSPYHLDHLVSDVVGLLDHLGQREATLVGHDWGAAVAWETAIRHPERVERLAVLNVPHPDVMLQALRRSPRQMARSWYIGLFQLPHLPEALLSARDARTLEALLQRSARDGTFSAEELTRYRGAWSQPGAITAMLNWYRAFVRRPPRRSDGDGRVQVPVSITWGARDVALGRELAERSLARCANGDLEFVDHATHWVQHEAADRVNERLLAFMAH